ncbi:hypothetical protein J4Q44_G00171090 [Coregonus suidteri]|uniref:Uncharacterized protein n=1 Tax=Coregonus suidteri TaxID=861788 RepID=A0AAN8LHI9_9TELE
MVNHTATRLSHLGWLSGILGGVYIGYILMLVSDFQTYLSKRYCCVADHQHNQFDMMECFILLTYGVSNKWIHMEGCSSQNPK